MANEYHECECPYHDVYDEKQDIDIPYDCPNQGTIRVPGYGWLCPECYDMIDAALKHWSDNIDLLRVFDDQGNRIG